MVKYDLKYVDTVSQQEMADSFNKDYFIDESLSYRHITNAIVSPKGVCTDEYANKGGGK